VLWAPKLASGNSYEKSTPRTKLYVSEQQRRVDVSARPGAPTSGAASMLDWIQSIATANEIGAHVKDPRQLALEVINGTEGSVKLDAAFGELLSAYAMFNLWSYQTIKGDLYVSRAALEAADTTYTELVTELNQAWDTFVASSDKHLASGALIAVALRVARDLKGILGDIDFYDDSQMPPWMGDKPAQAQHAAPAQSDVAPDNTPSLAPPNAPPSTSRVNAGIGPAPESDGSDDKNGQ
jgi:hypothetical protein